MKAAATISVPVPPDQLPHPRWWRSLGMGLVVLWLLAITLSTAGLGQLPLRDWDESLVARVALEAAERRWPEVVFPVFWGDPYLNKPPGLHLLIAAAIRLWRAASGTTPDTLPPEEVLRLVPALLSSTVVPLVGLVQARLRPGRPAIALASAAMALTLLPLARHGRLVMLDGSQLAAILLLWWALLSPDQRRGGLLFHGVLTGLAGSALLLLKAPLAIPLLGGSLLLRAWDRAFGKRQWIWLLVGLVVGLLPGLAWHGAHALERGPAAMEMWLGQGFARVHQRMEGHSGGPVMPITEVLKGGWPWLALWPSAMGLAWRERRTRAGRWCLGTTLLTAALVLPLSTQLPWYSLLLWPPLLLSCAPVLVWLVDRSPDLRPGWPALTGRIPAFWALLGALLGVFALVAWINGSPALSPLAPVAAAGGAGLLGGGLWLLAGRRRRRLAGAFLLIVGLWGALLTLLNGPLWLWELNERWPVGPVASLVRQHPEGSVHLWRMEERPSLNWYAGQRIRTWEETSDRDGRTQQSSLLLLSLETPAGIRGFRCVPLPQGGPLQLFRCSPAQPPQPHGVDQNPQPGRGGDPKPSQRKGEAPQSSARKT